MKETFPGKFSQRQEQTLKEETFFFLLLLFFISRNASEQKVKKTLKQTRGIKLKRLRHFSLSFFDYRKNTEHEKKGLKDKNKERNETNLGHMIRAEEEKALRAKE